MGLDLTQSFFLAQELGNIFAFTKLSNDVEVVLCFEYIVESEKVNWVARLNGL